MKLLFASDIHGSAYWCNLLAQRIAAEAPDRLILLGDLLYHGPRNDLPQGYAPKEVIQILNGFRDRIVAVRGNCDAEVDQMVLEFPIMADSALLLLDGTTVFCTHGHLFSPDAPPNLQPGDILMSGHTHLSADEMRSGFRCLNPGSVSMPKNGQPNSYMIYENRRFTLKVIED